MRLLKCLLAGCLIFTFSKNSSFAQDSSVTGAWQLLSEDGEDARQTSILLIMDGYIFFSDYTLSDKNFEGSIGGMYSLEGNKLEYDIEFNTYSADQVGDAVTVQWRIDGEELFWRAKVDGYEYDMVYTRVDTGEGDLAGAWRITDRMRNGEMTAMRQGSRKTIKMITGTRFQWAAYDPATQRFSGTGGGTIELKDGKYTENIEFFSRNKDRVGAKLTFDYKVNGIKWDHSGLSSSGNPIREIWTRQNQ